MEVQSIRSVAVPHCPVCGTTGKALYAGLQDRLSDAPGKWDFKQCPNPDCGLLWLDPMPVEDDLIYAYQNYYTHSSTSTNPRKQAMLNWYIKRRYGYAVGQPEGTTALKALVSLLDVTQITWLDTQVMYLPAKPGGKLLEIGSGNGAFLERMTQLGWDAEGIEFDPKSVALMQAKGLNARLGSTQDYADNTFDAITLSHVVEHFHQPIEQITDCYRILKPGGTLTLLTPNCTSLTYQWFKSDSLMMDPPRHLHLFNPASMRLLLQHSGFKDMKIWTTTRNANHFFNMGRHIARTGHAPWDQPTPLPDRILGKLVEYLEVVAVRFNPSLGEELTVIARK